MAGQFRHALRIAPQLQKSGSARLFSTQSSLRQEVRDAYILSASRTPTAKVSGFESLSVFRFLVH